MKTSETISKFAAAFAKTQGKIGSAHKDSKNPHFNSSYADLASVTDAIRPAAAENGIGYFQDGTLVDGNRLLLTTRVIHESGEWVEYEMLMPVAKMDPQGFGSAMTYARRYALAAAFGVAPAEDDDGNAASGRPSAAPAKQYSQPAQAQAKPAAQAAPAAAGKGISKEARDALVNAMKAAAAKGLASLDEHVKTLSDDEKRAIGKNTYEACKASAASVG